MLTRSHAVALAAAWALLLCLAATPAEAHSQLVSSSPGAAAYLDTSPEEIRLVFSEPVEPRFTGLRLSDADGLEIPVPAGTTDPADPHTWVMRLSAPLPNGIYTVDWHAMSASDGHTTTGFFTFGVGIPILRPGTASGTGTGAGDLHSGHDVGPAVVEVTGRALGYVGFMLAFGLFVFGFIVLRPALPPSRGSRRSPRASPGAGSAGSVAGGSPGGPLAAAWWRRLGASDPWSVLIAAQAVALLAGGVGAAVLGLATSSGPGADLVDYLAGTRSGLLVVARLGVALAGAATVVVLLRAGRPGPATAAGGLAGFLALVFVAISGHASSFASPAPLAVMIVHLGAVSVWLAGLVSLAWLALAAGRRDLLRATVPSFSALALVSVALIALTGAAAAWAETREILPFGTPYGLALAAKIAIFALALGLGAVNFLDGGRGRPTFGFLRGRLLVEATVAAIVLLAAGNLASGSPPGPERPVEIARAPSTAPSTIEIGLDLQPGRPGANRFEVIRPAGIADRQAVVLLLQRLDQNAGESRIDLRQAFGAAAARVAPGALFVADGGLLPTESQWEATAVLVEADGTEVTRQRFTFTMGQQGITRGRVDGPLDPASVIGFVLLGLAVLAVSFAVGGGRLPRTEQAASRVALLAGGAAAGILALALLFAGIDT